MEYMLETYYDTKVKEFDDPNLGNLTMDGYVKKFLKLLRYIPYFKDDKLRIQHFLTGFP
jgi:hypothetical protein